MAESSLRAARPSRKGGLPNAVFLVAAVEALPDELHGQIDELTILFPWGSLLRAALALDDASLGARSIAGLLAPEASARVVASVDARDRLDVPALTAADAAPIATRWARVGLELTAFSPVTANDVAAAGSTWARKLGVSRDRQVWQLNLRRPGALKPTGRAERRAFHGALAGDR
jgi:16S rRNA (adenine(1408)-N(1))-methyltransferase